MGVSRGRFITLEGVDGCGKSTQAALLAEALRAIGTSVVAVREPGGTPVGEAIRGVVLEAAGAMDPITEACLFAASRAELVRTVIRPALADGCWVVCDRFLDSSLAYQGFGRGLGVETIERINADAVDGCLPDRTILVDVPLDVSTSRRCADQDRIEAEGHGLQRAVADGYRWLSQHHSERITVVSGMGDPDEVHRRVREAVGIE